MWFLVALVLLIAVCPSCNKGPAGSASGLTVLKTAASPTEIQGIDGIGMGSPEGGLAARGFKKMRSGAGATVYSKEARTTVSGISTSKRLVVAAVSGRIVNCTVTFMPGNEKVAKALADSLKSEYDDSLFSGGKSKFGAGMGMSTLQDGKGHSLTFTSVGGVVSVSVDSK
jgi:hypothetical protein